MTAPPNRLQEGAFSSLCCIVGNRHLVVYLDSISDLGRSGVPGNGEYSWKDPLEPRLAIGHCAPHRSYTHAYVLIFDVGDFGTASVLLNIALMQKGQSC